MTTPAVAPTTPAPAAPAPGNTIQDAIDQLFASKEAAKPEPVRPATEVAPVVETPAVEAAAEGEAPAEVTEETPAADTPAPPKVGAADYAIQLAKARRKLAAATPPKPAQAAPSTAALELARALDAAGDDPLKRFEAAKLDLARVVQAYDNRIASDPDSADPLAKEVKTLGEKLARYEEREKAAEDAANESAFFAAAGKAVKAAGDKYEHVATRGEEGLKLVKELVLEAYYGHPGDPAKGIAPRPSRLMLLAEAIEEAEAFYDAEVDKAAKTKKAAKKFAPPQTPKTKGIPQQAPAAGAAPATQTKPTHVRDVIETEINALLG